MSVLRLLRTASYLKPQQIYGRVYYKLARPAVRLGDVPARRVLQTAWVAPVERPISLLSPERARFLGEEGDIAAAGAWNDARHEKLWLYNLHYFDDLNGARADERAAWHRALIARWVAENPPGRGNGWEPYPSSLRIVNWIKWALRENVVEPRALESLAVQTRWLLAHIEWHLLGNHLLANAKALVFAGLFFEGAEAERWLARGIEIYRRELGEQILGDGGHFERSPMYHAIILEDLLDVLNAGRAFGRDLGLELAERIARMRRWLGVMTLGDGRISFFNDAAFGIAAEPAELDAYASRLGLPPEDAGGDALVRLGASGYVRLCASDAIVLADVAAIGPDYLPGHAHADTLSFEMSLGAERVVVNGGTSRYGTGVERDFERSTAAHSTVEIDGLSSSEVWSGFRVGRRARVRDVQMDQSNGVSRLSASHDGYAWRGGRPIHKRSWSLRDGQLTVTDAIEGRMGIAVARFHLGAGVMAQVNADCRSGSLVLPSGHMVRWATSQPATLAASAWHPEFGRSVPTQQIVVPLGGGPLETVFGW
ncbi:MAG TPA: alginate lyase family protein [Rhizomicrobium sp.]|jgi:uncharacterized heparinase superfamily protein|nr:alginate lyase family protein [Rhizomicrobium sp.]